MSVEIRELSLPQIDFDENIHVYRLNGIELPSVTSIMSPISEAYYGGINEHVMQYAAHRGTAIHNAIENYIRFGAQDIATEYSGYFGAFLSWMKDKKPEIYCSETRVYHKAFMYAGTSDLFCAIGSKHFLVDVKSSSKIVDCLVRVQLEAYARAYASHDIRFDGKMALHLGPDGSYETRPYNADIEAWNVFEALLTLQGYKKKYIRR